MRISPASSPRKAFTRAAFRALTTLGLSAGLGLLAGAPTTRADDFQWTGGSGNFNSVGNPGWTALPGTRDNGINNVDGTTITIDATSTNNGTPGMVFLDDVRSGTDTSNVNTTWEQESGTTVGLTGEGWFRLGDGPGTVGTYNLNGGTLQNNDANQWNIGEGNGGTGVLNMNGGALINTNGAADRIAIGNNQNAGGATGTLNMSNGATIDTNGEIWVGQGGGDNGTLNLSNGTITLHNWLATGRDSGNGTVNLTGGNIIKDSTANAGSHVTFGGVGTTQTGTLNMSGGNLTVQTGGNAIWVVEGATGVINLTGGTLTANDGIEVTHDIGTGRMNVSGGTLNAPGGTELNHAGGNGTLDLQGVNSGPTGALPNAGGTEVVTIPTVTLGSTDPNYTGSGGSGTVILEGGTLATNGFVDGTGTGAKTLSFNGGTLQATSDSDSFLGTGGITTQVLAGAAVFDTNGHSVTVTTQLVSGFNADTKDGGLTKIGAGMLTLTGSNSYTGPTVVSAGTLVVSNFIGNGQGAGPVTVAAGATLSGNGALSLGASAVTINGVLAPGVLPTAGSVGTLTVATSGTLTLSNTSTLAFDIINAANKDLIAANGAKLTLGGTLALNLGASFSYGLTYTVFSGLASAPTGSFANVTGTDGVHRAVLTLSGSNYNLSFVAVPEPSTWALGVFGLGGLAAISLCRRRMA